MRRIAYVIPSWEVGGAERTMLSWFEALRPYGWEVGAVFVQREGDLADVIRRRGFEVVTGTGSRFRNVAGYAADVRRIVSMVRRFGADLVHSSGAKGHLYGGVAARIAGVPAFWFVHDRPEPSAWMRLARAVPGAFAANSNSTADAAEAWFGRRPPVVYPAVEVERFRFDAAARTRVREQHRWGENAVVAGYVGRLQHWKGIHVFLEALASAARRRPALRGVVVGSSTSGVEPGHETDLHRTATELGLIPDTVRFLPYMADPAPLYSALDCLVHVPLRPEPFGISVVEGMAAGRWIIATTPGGTAETVSPETGQLVAPNDPEAVAGALVRFVDERGLRDCALKSGPARAQLFNADSSARGLAQVLAEAMV